jgi:general secretion pathway protein G
LTNGYFWGICGKKKKEYRLSRVSIESIPYVFGASTLNVTVVKVLSKKSIFTKGQKMKSQSGFTLVEILIVVVILGILAAIVIPQFTDASTEAKTSRLCSDLQSVRSQIELYKIQHNDQLPGTVPGVTFTQALTGYTLQDGTLAANQQPAPGVFGPYMQTIPVNPFVAVAANAQLIATSNDPTATVGACDDSTGWWFNTITGLYKANDDDGHGNL